MNEKVNVFDQDLNNSSIFSQYESFMCPITCEVFQDPVITIADGHTYERTAIVEWLKTHNTSPRTGLPLITKDIVPNYALQSLIVEISTKFKKNNGNHGEYENNMKKHHTETKSSLLDGLGIRSTSDWLLNVGIPNKDVESIAKGLNSFGGLDYLCSISSSDGKAIEIILDRCVPIIPRQYYMTLIEGIQFLSTITNNLDRSISNGNGTFRSNQISYLEAAINRIEALVVRIDQNTSHPTTMTGSNAWFAPSMSNSSSISKPPPPPQSALTSSSKLTLKSATAINSPFDEFPPLSSSFSSSSSSVSFSPNGRYGPIFTSSIPMPIPYPPSSSSSPPPPPPPPSSLSSNQSTLFGTSETIPNSMNPFDEEEVAINQSISQINLTNQPNFIDFSNISGSTTLLHTEPIVTSTSVSTLTSSLPSSSVQPTPVPPPPPPPPILPPRENVIRSVGNPSTRVYPGLFWTLPIQTKEYAGFDVERAKKDQFILNYTNTKADCSIGPKTIYSDSSVSFENPTLKWKFKVSGNHSWYVGVVPEHMLEDHDYLQNKGKMGLKSMGTVGGNFPGIKMHELEVCVILSTEKFEVYIQNAVTPIVVKMIETLPARLGLCGFAQTSFQLLS